MSSKKSQPDRSDINPSRKDILLSWAVFIPTVIIVLLSLSSVVFPALLVRTFSPFQGTLVSPEFVSPFQLGILAVPLVLVDIILLGIGFVHYKKKIDKITAIFNRVLEFELSKKQALVGVIILLGIFVCLTAGTLAKEETWVDYSGAKSATVNWTLSFENLTGNFKYFLLHSSLVIFNNIRVVPFISSIFLLLVTYFTTVEITKKRFAGIITLIIFIQSNNFLMYATSASYSSFWILFYILSIFLICKKWFLSPISYIFSFLSKAITAIFIPMTFFFIYRSEMPKKNKIRIIISYVIILSFFAVLSIILKFNPIPSINIDYYSFLNGFNSVAFQLRFDGLVLIFLLPLVIGLFIKSRRGILYADSILFFIMVAIMSSPLLSGIANYTLEPYRQISLVVFFSIGVGVLLSKSKRPGELLSSTK